MSAPLGTTRDGFDAVTRLSDAGLPPWLLIGLANLIGCDAVLIAQTVTEQLDHSVTQRPQDGTLVHGPAASGSDLDRAQGTGYGVCLPRSQATRTGEHNLSTVWNLYTGRQSHSTPSYPEVFPPQGPDREHTMGIPSDATGESPGTLVQLFFVRARGPEFSDRDRAALTVLQPHLRDAYPDPERTRQNPEPRLTARQQEVLTLVAEGSTNAQIASRLSISAGTVRKHLENAYRILGVSNRIAAISTLTTRRPYQSAASRAS
jgi:DNA-binding CsgD family transcriptional regulator